MISLSNVFLLAAILLALTTTVASAADFSRALRTVRSLTSDVEDTLSAEPHGRNVVDCGTPDPFPVSSFAATSLHPVVLCDILQAFDKMGRDENNDPSTPLNWPRLCDDFDPVDSYLCPNANQLSDICDHPNPHLNPAVKENYCEPMFASIADTTAQAQCTRMCINYVSQFAGDCCEFEC